MSDIQEMLIELGLSKTEAIIYMAGLQHPSVGVAELQKLTSIKRPTIYHALHELTSKGLVAKSGAEGRLHFSFAPPEQLRHLVVAQMNIIKRRGDLVENLLPAIRQQSLTEDQTVVSHYEGIEGVKTVIDIALYCRAPQWDILAPATNFFSEFDEDFARYFMDTRKRQGIKARSLWETKQSNGKLEHSLDQAAREPRYLPPVMYGRFKSVIILFDNKVAIISSADALSAILIESTEIHALFQSMFEGLWSVSEQR
jgi:sugar-specific transcriptional regulator TrmB